MSLLVIVLAAALALAAPLLARAPDVRRSPRVAAGVHLWALIAIGASPLALALCLAGPGAPGGTTCPGTAGHGNHLLAWAALGSGTLVVAALAVAGLGTLRATRAAHPRRLGQPNFTAEGVPVHVLPLHRPLAFAVGVVRPRIVLSRGLLKLLDGEELRAVIAHELGHVRGGHLGALLVGRAVARVFGVVPPVRHASAALLRELEAAADDHAAQVVGDRDVVAAAIAKVALAGAPLSPGGFGGGGDLAYRVDRLLDPRPPSRGRQALGVALVALLVLGTVAAQCGALHGGAAWAGVASCALLGWVGSRPLRPSPPEGAGLLRPLAS